MSRANDNPTTLRWFRLSDLRRHGWGEQRIHDVLKNADPEHWRCYQHEQRQRQLARESVCGLAVDCLEDKATFSVVGTEPSDPMMWSVCVEEVALLLPADADGAPLSPEDAQVALALPVDVSNAPASTLEEDPEDHPDVPTLRQEMILAILDQKFPDSIPKPRRPAQLTEIVRQGWKAECERRPGVKYSPPDRKTVMSTVTRWRP